MFCLTCIEINKKINISVTVFNNNVQPVLILGAHNVVIRRAADMIDEPVVIYNTSCLIKGN